MIKILIMLLTKTVFLGKFFIKIVDDILLLGVNIFEIVGKFLFKFFDNFLILPRASYHLFDDLDLDKIKDYLITYWLQLLIILIIIYLIILLLFKKNNS